MLATATAAGTVDGVVTIVAGTEDEAETIARSTADAAGTEAIVAEAMAIETGGMATEATAEAGVDMMTMLARVIGATWRGRSCLLERSGRGSTGRREKTVLAARRGHTLPSTSRPRKKCCPRFR